ncbi:MAG: sensor histidine kinase [Sporolactobacillus sp.]
MNLFKRECLTAVFFSLALLILFTLFYFIAFPPNHWELLWEKEIWHLPFLFIVPAVCLFCGLAVGIFSGFYWRNVFMNLEDAVTEMAQGKPITADHLANGGATPTLVRRMEQLAEQVSKQTQMTQRMANETAELEEQAIRKVVSEERNRLARELHDSVSQQLFAASMLLSTINENRTTAPNAETRQLILVEQAIHQSQLEMRALFLHLRPVQLHGKALKKGMEELLNELRMKVPMDIRWTIEPLSLEKGIEDQLFRILQESVSNVLRHAKARTLTVLLIARDNLTILRITDDGIGFQTKENKPGSYGLNNMRERSAQIGGQFKLVSVPGKGTSLEVKVPIIRGEEK